MTQVLRPGEEILRRSNAGKFPELPVEVRLIGIARFQGNIDPSKLRCVDATPQRFLKSEKARVGARRSAYGFAEELNEVRVAVARLLDKRGDIRARGKATQRICHRRMESRRIGQTAA